MTSLDVRHSYCFLWLTLPWLVAAGCSRKVEPARSADAGPAAAVPGKRALPGRTVSEYVLTGVVRKVEAQKNHVRIAHDKVPGFMDAMEMRFFYKDGAFLHALEPLDRVKGTLRVVRENGAVIEYELLDLQVTKPAPPQRKVLSLAGGKAQMQAEPKRLTVGEPLADFTMTTHEGKSQKLSDWRGKVVVLTFVYTRCPLPDFCPLMDKKFAELSRRLETNSAIGSRVRLLSLSFDPDHDTPEVLRKHAQLRGVTPPLWTYAVATHEELAKIAAPLGLMYAPGDREIAHNLCTAIIDQEGNLARLEVGTERNKWDAGDLLNTIYSLVSASTTTPK